MGTADVTFFDHDGNGFAELTGWASASLDTTTNPSAVVTWFPVQDLSRGGGVNPSSNTSSLLRLNNRGVCEVCHNK